MDPIFSFNQPNYYGGYQQPLISINLPGLVPQPQPQVRTPLGDGGDALSLLNSQTAAGVGVASTMWQHSNMGGYARVGYRGAFGGAGLEFGMGAALKSSLVAGAVMSTIVNGYRLMNNQQTGAVSFTNILSDVAASGVGAIAGSVAAAAGGAILGGFLAPGLLLTLCTAACGLGGIMLADNMLRQSQWFQQLQWNIYSMFA